MSHNLHQLPELLAWKMGLSVDRSDVMAFYEDAEQDQLKPTVALHRLGHSDGWAGAPIHLPAEALQGGKLYNTAYTPAIMLELPCIDGMVMTVALTSAAAETLIARLGRCVTALEKWFDEDGERRMQNLTQELLTVCHAQIMWAKNAQQS